MDQSKNKLSLKKSKPRMILMPWEVRHQHTLKDFFTNAQNSDGDDAPGRKNRTPEINAPKRSSEIWRPSHYSVFDGDKMGSNNNWKGSYSPDQGTFRTNDVDTAPKIEATGKDDVDNDGMILLASGSSSTPNTRCSVLWDDEDVFGESLSNVIPSSLPATPDLTPPSFSTSIDVIQSSLSTSLSTSPDKPLRRECTREGDRLASLRCESQASPKSCVRERGACGNSNSVKGIVNHCGYKNSVSLRANKNPAGLNKTFKYAAKFNLEKMFTYSFPKGKRPLRDRLL